MFYMDDDEKINDDFKILHEPVNNIDEKIIVKEIIKKDPIIKSFFESLKSTFGHFWYLEDKTHWMRIIKIFSILDTYHLTKIIRLYNEHIFLRYNTINNYLKNISQDYKEKNCNYFIIAIQHFLQKR